MKSEASHSWSFRSNLITKIRWNPRSMRKLIFNELIRNISFNLSLCSRDWSLKMTTTVVEFRNHYIWNGISNSRASAKAKVVLFKRFSKQWGTPYFSNPAGKWKRRMYKISPKLDKWRMLYMSNHRIECSNMLFVLHFFKVDLIWV